MRRITFALSTLLLVEAAFSSLSRAAIAVQMTGGELYEACSAIDQPKTGNAGADFEKVARQRNCLSYLQGVMDTAAFLEVVAPKPAWCVPEGVTVEQVIRVVVKYLHDHPQTLHERGATLVLLSLSDAFPCAAK